MMAIGGNLATRITALLLIGFVLLQLVVFALMALPNRGTSLRPYNLPSPSQLGAMADAIERAPAAERPPLLALFNGSLSTVRLLPAAPPRESEPEADDLRALERAYRAALPGRAIIVEGGTGRLNRALRHRPGPIRFLSPVHLFVSLQGGGTLEVDSRPSMLVRNYLRQRALLGLIGGLMVLAALAFGIRATTRPLTRMSAGVRRFATALDAPDLPVTGAREVRELSSAFNEMKARIGGLIGERTRMLAAIAHDMRTYLTRLRLRAEYIDDAEQRTKAVQDLDEMALLLDDTLLFAKTDNGASSHPEPIHIATELARIVAQRIEMGCAVTLEGDAAGTVMADRIALHRMLANLIDNGLRYGTKVKLTVHETDEMTQVAVADDGPGVPADALTRLGQPYARIDPSRDRASGGAGLGLAIVRALAGQMGARLTLANRTPHGLLATLTFMRA
ncbi:ATP-binding protein [Sphingomonas sp. MMS24-J13]|uniref:ATP-binding protein n=1 Tax=Sphingomonas sp. MMS24-J13 TaxID=3238686 RepID=UPI003850C5C7